MGCVGSLPPPTLLGGREPACTIDHIIRVRAGLLTLHPCLSVLPPGPHRTHYLPQVAVAVPTPLHIALSRARPPSVLGSDRKACILVVKQLGHRAADILHQEKQRAALLE